MLEQVKGSVSVYHLFQKFYQTVMKKSSKQLKNLQGKPLNAPATNYCQMLQEIAEAQRFEVLYTDIPELSAYGKISFFQLQSNLC